MEVGADCRVVRDWSRPAISPTALFGAERGEPERLSFSLFSRFFVFGLIKQIDSNI